MNRPHTWYLKRMVSGSVFLAALFSVIWFVGKTLGDRREAELTSTYVQEIISNLDLASVSDFHERVEKVRIFINDNSVFSVDDTFWKNKAYPSSFAAGLLAHSKGTASKPVHMECSTRTNLMSNILRKLGYETRVVAIFNSNENSQLAFVSRSDEPWNGALGNPRCPARCLLAQQGFWRARVPCRRSRRSRCSRALRAQQLRMGSGES